MESRLFRIADRAGIRRFTLYGIAAYFTDIVINRLIPARIVQHFLIERCMDLFYIIIELEAPIFFCS